MRKTQKTVCWLVVAALTLACLGAASAEAALPDTWDEVVKTYHLPEIPYIEPPVTGDLPSGQVAVSGLAQYGFLSAQILYHTGENAGFVLKPNVTMTFGGAYDAQSDTWLFADRLMEQAYMSLSVGEGEYLIARFTKPLGETEDGWTCEYRYELVLNVNNGQTANGYENSGVYVEYRPAQVEGGPDEMRLTVTRVHDEYTVTLYEHGEQAATKTYSTQPQMAVDAEQPQPVDDPSTVEGLFLTLAQADFLPQLTIPDYVPEWVVTDEQWLIRNVPEADYTKIQLHAYTSDYALLTDMALEYDKAQSAYVCAVTEDAKQLTASEAGFGGRLTLGLPLPSGASTYSQEYKFDRELWQVVVKMPQGDYSYIFGRLSDGQYQLSCWDGGSYSRWRAWYDEQGALVSVEARPDVIK